MPRRSKRHAGGRGGEVHPRVPQVRRPVGEAQAPNNVDRVHGPLGDEGRDERGDGARRVHRNNLERAGNEAARDLFLSTIRVNTALHRSGRMGLK